MSHTTMLIIDNDGDCCGDSEYRNAWGFGPMIWGALLRKYHATIPGLENVPEPSMIMDAQKLWDAVNAGKVDLRPWEHDVLFATYDRAMIRGADLERMATSMEMFAEAHAQPGSACSIRAIAKRLRDLVAGVETKFVSPDVCFQGTSVSEDQWYVCGDDDEDDGRPYNIKRDTGHWYVEFAPEARRAGSAA